LCGHCSTEGFASNHNSAGIGDQRQQNNDVAVDAVHESPLLADGRCELKDHEKTGSWREYQQLLQIENTVAILTYDGVEMESDPDLVAVEVLIVVTFTRRSVIRPIVRSAEDTGDVQIHQSSKSESEQGSSEDEPLSC
jgi:hypothetical protein